MANIKKWLYKYNEDGFINKEHETLERILMISFGVFIVLCLIILLVWVIKDSGSQHI